MEPWALRTRKVRELEQELSVVLDDADCRAAGSREGSSEPSVRHRPPHEPRAVDAWLSVSDNLETTARS